MWTSVLTTRAGVPLGELRQPSTRSWRRGVKAGLSASVAIPTNSPLAIAALASDTMLLKQYDDRDGTKRLRHHGPISGHQKDVEGSDGTITLTSFDPRYRLLTRLLGLGPAGATIGTALAPVDRGEALGQLVDALNQGSGPLLCQAGDTGIRRGTITPSSGGYWGPWRFHAANAAWNEIAAGLDAPEIYLRPVEPTMDAHGLRIAELDVAAFFGTVKASVVFEHGTGRHNVPKFTDVGDNGVVATEVWNLPPNYPDAVGQVPMVETDAVAIALRGRREALVDAAVTTDPMRRQLLQDHLTVRKQPRRIITFTVIRDPDPVGTPLERRRVPRPFVDFAVGDVVRFRADELIDVRDEQGRVVRSEPVTTVDGWFRVHDMTITPDNLDGETIDLTLTQESDGA